ncbi:non-classical arabinogalactan protein 30 [Eutrema salsugineum]|uniref:non-classical arabinogalactan protein 30 n=1 Tax=Eutrema salsugineum TaxID=72664 RepID=UPI000CED0661|nr:non-classical arabinogalactan protein 30 [Eutrema salsugineum]
MGFIAKSVLLTLLALCCFTSSVLTTALPPLKSPIKLPTLPPAKSPIKLPTFPPAKAPIKLPTFPPAKAPIKLPTYPPAKAPIKLPTFPPTKAPIKLPTFPPAKAPIKLPTFPPAKAPIKLPTFPPAKAPIKPPVLPPLSPPKFMRTLVAVRGMVYCKACKYAGVNNLQGAKPVKGAVVRLLCKNKKNVISETKTDKNGYFLIYAPKTVTNYGIKGCRAYLVKSPNSKCSKVSKLHGGYMGSVLKPVVKPENSTVIVNKLTYGLFNVGPFAFEPVCPK